MKRLCLLLATVLSVSGCASDPQWEEVRKDLRGDNMKMKGFADAPDTDPLRTPMKPADLP